jgi:predicted HAD superfamily Cof-like phosphohydrolase
MNEFLEKVEEFHNTFNAPVLVEPTIPSEDRCELRVNLLQEELNELVQAIKDKDIVEIADALADLQVVLSGSVLEFGMANKFGELFDEVHRSNMSKACDTMKDAISTIAHYKKKDGVESTYSEKDGKYLVNRSNDNKILKSVNYSPANLKKIIEK